MKILVTAFEPFGGEALNASREALTLADKKTAGADIVKLILPVVFGESARLLERAVQREAPDAVLCLGEAGGRDLITPERVAINVDDARIPDTAGRQPVDTAVHAGGPAAYFSTLPIKAMVRDMRAAGVPAAVSNTAGTFVCNHIFYALMHRLAAQAGNATGAGSVRGGFIHVPTLPELAALHPGMPSMALATQVQGLQIAIETALAVRSDVREVGGALH